MRRRWDLEIQRAEESSTVQRAFVRAVDSQDGIDRSQGAALREIAWTLSGWIGFVVAVQLLLHVLHIA